MMRRHLGWLAAALALVGCDQLPEEPVVKLPPGLVEGATDPRRWAISQVTAMLLDRPASLAGKPAEAARAVALIEYLTTAFQDGRYPDGARLTRLLREARAPLRLALGIQPEAAPQVVVDALFAAAAANSAAPLAGIAASAAAAWVALASFEPPPMLRRALRLLRETQLPDVMPS